MCTFQPWSFKRRAKPILKPSLILSKLAGKLVEERTIPGTHPEDALHVAVAAINGMDFLLTWNFSHLNNASAKARIRKAVETEGYQCPEICSIDELLGEGK